MPHAFCTNFVYAATTAKSALQNQRQEHVRTRPLHGGRKSSQYARCFRASRVVMRAAYGAGEVEATIAELRSLLDEAVAGEDYKNAAKIRDELM